MSEDLARPEWVGRLFDSLPQVEPAPNYPAVNSGEPAVAVRVDDNDLATARDRVAELEADVAGNTAHARECGDTQRAAVEAAHRAEDAARLAVERTLTAAEDVETSRRLLDAAHAKVAELEAIIDTAHDDQAEAEIRVDPDETEEDDERTERLAAELHRANIADALHRANIADAGLTHLRLDQIAPHARRAYRAMAARAIAHLYTEHVAALTEHADRFRRAHDEDLETVDRGHRAELDELRAKVATRDDDRRELRATIAHLRAVPQRGAAPETPPMTATGKPEPYTSGLCGIGWHHACRGTYAGTICACPCGHRPAKPPPVRLGFGA